MAAYKIMKAHKRFILMQVAAFNDSCISIRDMLRDEEVAKANRFNPVSVCHQAVSQAIHKLNSEEIGLERARFLTDFSDLPLAFKKPRVNELCKAYRELTRNPSAYGKGVLRARMEILRDIKNEIGEDIDKLAKALGRTGDQHLHFNFGDVSDDRREQIRRNITAAWPVTTDG